ncbi:phosphoglucomutase/phosphomannomutase alpha/beta/alpha domain I [Candidatus Vecturithrix granuli]|uniref:Phosphoglucomutase/phosphomannomutase alpha/beta/alpha domain I n=1 Tax=Vecturithrix granuli TaxID=1499967 RepID=A0A081C9N0_VECG1|nr:phosphoglucomutase/phosphomannomutase alpha/beta/alpha domain I [Candidatus Vecturithrix granuli]
MARVHALKISISGVRGVVGDFLTPQLIESFAKAFGTFTGEGRITVGRDTRTSGEMLFHAVCSGLLSTGCIPIDLGICPTPSVQIRTKETEAIGGIIITASHNPAQWNALKFVGKDGRFLDEYESRSIVEIYHDQTFRRCPDEEINKVRSDPQAIESHLKKVLAYLDVELIRQKHFKVAFDCCNGAGSLMTPRLLQELGCQLIPINTEPNGLFPREPEPTPQHLTQLCSTTKLSGADVGFAQDADADRLAIVNEHGEAIGEDYTLALAVQFVLSKTPGPVVINLSTSRVIEDIAAQYHCPVYRTKIGESNVIDKILECHAIVGGEGNGGVMIPAIHPCRDSFIGMGLVLQCMAETGKTISELVEAIPRYFMVKRKVPLPSDHIFGIVDTLTQKYANAHIDTTDGLKILLDDQKAWIHVRPSNTEPILRVVSEATSQEAAKKLNDMILKEAGLHRNLL